MTIVWGALLAAGVLLVVAPWLWPRRDGSPAVTSRGRRSAIDRLIAESGASSLTPARLAALCALAGCVAGAVFWLATVVAVVALVGAAAAALAPIAWLRARRLRRRKERRGLWPDVCDLLIASVRAGMSLPDAVASLSTSVPAPLRPAFEGFARDLAASGHFSSALTRLKGTLADPVADRIIETLRMAREVGGTDLTTVLRALAASVRADAALRAEVEARQSWIRGAAVLGVSAPWVILILLSLRPEGAEAYGSAAGAALVLVGAIVSGAAFWVMVRIGRLPEPRRWFA